MDRLAAFEGCIIIAPVVEDDYRGCNLKRSLEHCANPAPFVPDAHHAGDFISHVISLCR
jgi:hypothetical protein